MGADKEILIIGAGSTGLSSALFQVELGLKPRIIEKRLLPSTNTKALGVNSNTLKLLENTEITKRFLENGYKVSCFNFWCKNRIVYKNDLSKVDHPYPFMLVQPQFETERILEEALATRDIFVERGIELENIYLNDHSTKLTLKNKEEIINDVDFKGIVVGADGSKSRVRELAGIEFNGWEHHEKFTLYDVELETPVSHKEGHYHFFKEGGMLMLHIRDGVWRIGGNTGDVFNFLPKGTKVGKISWETTFTIREKVAETFNLKNVYLLGDAGHIHSPAGAKGMNLCIEDSYIFAQLLKQNREAQYHLQRHSKIKKAVGILGQLTDKIGGHNIVGNTLRSNMDKLSFLFPIVMPRMRKFLLGIS
jgi:2-polyprenyl-6-methoxyphenol hydroxylase-like FAD-dependent oxidoreductase